MKYSYILSTLVLFSLIFSAVPSASAYVNTGWDWHLVNGEPKRTLHYCAGVAQRVQTSGRSVDVQAFTRGVPPAWATWLTEAAENLNNANTGWRLEPSGATFPPCQVLILLADISEEIHGGGVATPQDNNGDGMADLVRIIIDSNLEDTTENLPEDQDTNDGSRDGWNREGDATMDPVGVLMHELTHAMRLDHHPDSKHSDTDDGDISDPRKPGQHETTLSEEDLQEMRDAYGSQEEQTRTQVGQNDQTIEHEGVGFAIAEGTFDSPFAFLDFNIYEGVAIPAPLAVPEGYSHVIGSGTIYWRTTMPPAQPVTISIPYSDEELAGGDGMYFGDLHGFVPPALKEDSLTVMKYIQRPFGVESDFVSHWERVEGAEVDTGRNVVTFQTQETGIYGIAGMADENSGGGGGDASSRTTVYIILGVVVLAGLGWGMTRGKSQTA